MGDYFYEMAMEAAEQIFEDLHRYYNEAHKIEASVLFDSKIDDFCRLCEE